MKTIPSHVLLTIYLQGSSGTRSTEEKLVGYETIEKSMRDPKTGKFGKYYIPQKDKPIYYKEMKYKPASQVRIISEECIRGWCEGSRHLIWDRINDNCKKIFEATPGAISYYWE